jgi:hypothetical protein
MDYDYSQKDGQSMVRLIQRSAMKRSLKSRGLRVQVSNLERDENVCTTCIYKFLKVNNVKRGFKTKRVWMKCKTS